MIPPENHREPGENLRKTLICEDPNGIHEGMSPRSKESLFSERRQPGRKDKPVTRALEIEDSEQVI